MFPAPGCGSIGSALFRYKDFIYANSLRSSKKCQLVYRDLVSDGVAEVDAHLHHVELQKRGLKLAEQGDTHSENCFPATLVDKHIEYWWQYFVGQETGEKSHEPLTGEVVRRHADRAQVTHQFGQVKLNELGHLEVLKMQFRHALRSQV